MKDIKTQLQSLGLSGNETEIYVSLLRLGSSKASLVMSQTGLQRSVVYTGLKSLCAYGLVTEKTDTKVSVFMANDPYSLIALQKQKLNTAEQVAAELRKIKEVENQEAFVYTGNDIITLTAQKSLLAAPGTTVYFFGSSKFGIQRNLEAFWKAYHHERAEKGIKAKILYDKFTPKEVIEYRNSLKNCEAKYLPIDIEIPISFIIWEDHVNILVPGEKPPTAFFIRNQDTADSLIEYFNYLWKQTKNVR